MLSHPNLMLIDALNTALRPFNFPGKARLLHSLCPQEGERLYDLFGFQIRLDLRDLIQRSIFLNVFEPEESSIVRTYLRPGQTFVDVGANIGYYTLMAARLVGESGHVMAFEPSQYIYERLRVTVEQNRLSRVRVIQAGLSDQEGEMNLYVQQGTGNNSPSMVANGTGIPVRVPVRPLDSYLDESGIHQVDLMKIDVEGFEPNVLRGASAHLKGGRIGAILCEFNRYWLMTNGSSPAALHQMLVDFGYRPQNESIDFRRELQNILYTRISNPRR
ncbi:MAG: FkbM family methyltransferase [Pyrinomonadaceae bacterium]